MKKEKTTNCEKRLQEALQWHDAVFQGSRDAIFINDRHYRFIDVNDAACRLTGYSRDELLSMRIQDLYDDVDLDAYMQYHKSILRGEETIGEAKIRHKDGTKIDTEFNNRVIVVKNKKYMHTDARDTTGRKRAEEERARLEEQLSRSHKLEGIGQLAGGIAHDFNNILTAIMGFGGLIRLNLPKDSPMMSNINEVLAAAHRGASLTQQILAFSRKQVLDLKLTDLNELIQNIEKLLRRLIREDIKLTFVLSQGALKVLADPSQIDQVLINLAANARDAMPDGGELVLSTEEIIINDEFIRFHNYGEPGKYALVKMTDTGIGIDEKTKERIFEPFFTTKEAGKGTGLGLAVVYGIVKQHNGFIIIDSRPGEGSTFSIYLPIVKNRVEAEASAVATSSAGATGGTETILIAEDDEGMRKSLIRTFDWFGYTVITAEDGNDAVRKFHENRDRIRLLLFDAMMPNKGGKEAYEEIKKISPDIKVIFMSGHEGDIVRGKGIDEKEYEFLSKPIPSDVLLKKIRQVLDE